MNSFFRFMKINISNDIFFSALRRNEAKISVQNIVEKINLSGLDFKTTATEKPQGIKAMRPTLKLLNQKLTYTYAYRPIGFYLFFISLIDFGNFLVQVIF